MLKVLDLYFERFLENQVLKDILNQLTPSEQYSLLNREVCPGYIELL